MGLLDKLWDDVAGGSPPESGLKQLRKEKSVNNAQFQDVPTDAKGIVGRRLSGPFQTSQNIAIKKPQAVGKLDMTESPVGTPSSLGSTPPASPSIASASYTQEKDNIWRSVFHPGQNKVMRHVGSDKFDKAQPNAPTVYDWMYGPDSKPEYR